MNILLITLGSHGDVHPFLALASALKSRGANPVLATNPYYERQIVESGVPFAGFTEYADLKEIITQHKVMDARRGPLAVLRKLTLPYVPEFVARTRALIRECKPSAVVYHPIVFGVPWACELEGGVPTVSIALSPLLWANPNDSMILLPTSSPAPSRFAVARDRWLSRTILRVALDPGLNRVRRELGLPKARDQFLAAACEADRNLGLWSPTFRGPLEGDPRDSAIVGFAWHDRDHTQEAPDDELRAFLDAGPPPIVFALGSTGVHASGRFYAHAVEAARTLKRRALLVVGRDQPPPANLPKDGSMKAVAYAPFSTVFARSCVTVHHGGVGTTAQGLRAGRPTLVTPMAHDQFDNGGRVTRLGCGAMLPFTKVNAKRLVAMLEPLVADDRYAAAARRVAASVGTEDGAARAAETLCGSGTA